MSIGALSGAVPVQLIDKVGCVAAKPQCPVSRVPADKYGIQGDGLPDQGFKAILGVNMAHAPADTPFPLIGARRWIIELPLPGAGRPGRLILNPMPEETTGFTAFPIDRRFADQRGGMHDAIPACLSNLQSKKAFCGPALLDTGAPGIIVINGQGQVWPNNTPAAMSFGAQPVTNLGFGIGLRDAASRLSFIDRPGPGGVQLHFGLTPYFGYRVLYDVDAGTVSLAPRKDTRLVVK